MLAARSGGQARAWPGSFQEKDSFLWLQEGPFRFQGLGRVL